MRIKSLLPVLSLLAAAGAWPAAAQIGQNSNAPVDITADELEVQSNECVSTWRGQAEALQDKARLRADVMTAHLEKKSGGAAASGGGSCGAIVSIEAKGSVYYVAGPDQRARGDAAFYDASNDTVTLTGDVIAVQGQNVLRGTKMVYNTKTGQGQMQGQSAGRNKAGRVRGVFYPSKSSDKPASTDQERR